MMWILTTRIGRALASTVAFIGSLIAVSWFSKRAGKKEILHEAKEQDHENAADLRNNIRNHLDERVRKMEGRGYRD